MQDLSPGDSMPFKVRKQSFDTSKRNLGSVYCYFYIAKTVCEVRAKLERINSQPAQGVRINSIYNLAVRPYSATTVLTPLAVGTYDFLAELM